MVQCNREIYKDIMKKFSGRWNNKESKFVVPIQNKAEIESLIANVKSIQSEPNGDENDINTPFQAKTEPEPERKKRKYTRKNPPGTKPTVELIDISEKANNVEPEVNIRDHEPEVKPNRDSEQETNNHTRDQSESEQETNNHTRDQSESEQETNTRDQSDSEQETNNQVKYNRPNYISQPSTEETFLKTDLLEVNRSDIESEEEFIQVKNQKKPRQRKVPQPIKPSNFKFEPVQQTKSNFKFQPIQAQHKPVQPINKKEPPKPPTAKVQPKQEPPKPPTPKVQPKFQPKQEPSKKTNSKSRFETDSVDYNEYNSDDEDIYEEESEEESESETQSETSETETQSEDERNYKKHHSDSEEESDYKHRNPKSRKSSSKSFEFDFEYKGQKHYTREEKEKLKRKIELLELKKAKKLGKPIEEVRAERNQTSVRFNELVKKVERLQEQVEELQYQVKKLSRR